MTLWRVRRRPRTVKRTQTGAAVNRRTSYIAPSACMFENGRDYVLGLADAAGTMSAVGPAHSQILAGRDAFRTEIVDYLSGWASDAGEGIEASNDQVEQGA